MAETFRYLALGFRQATLLSQELPTLSKLKVRRPDLYNNHNWHCCFCKEEETFEHLWICDSAIRQLTISYAISNTIEQLKNFLYLENVNLTHGELNQIDQLSCWTCLDNDTFNIIDIAKGLVPKELSNLVKQLGLNSYLTSRIILNVLHNLQLNFKQYWVDRYKVLIEKELSLNINKKLK